MSARRRARKRTRPAPRTSRAQPARARSSASAKRDKKPAKTTSGKAGGAANAAGGAKRRTRRARSGANPSQLAVRKSSLTVAQVIRYLIPHGTSDGKWDTFPIWPPDMFAVAAYLVDRSGCYATMRPDAIGARLGDRASIQHLKNVGLAWRLGSFLFPESERARFESTLPDTIDKAAVLAIEEEEIQRRWSALVACNEPMVVSGSYALESGCPDWWTAAVELLIIADEASTGVGFKPRDDSQAWVQKLCWVENIQIPQREVRSRVSSTDRAYEANVPHTLCKQVSADAVCVLPKTRTPTVGCTIRSMSHHLALLPSQGEVRARWHQLIADPGRPRVFNLLVVPFPYRVSGRGFKSSPDSRDEKKWGWFDTVQEWLPKDDSGDSGKVFAEFLKALIDSARTEVGSIDGIVLPELALDTATFSRVRNRLASDYTDDSHTPVGFLIAGVYDRSKSPGRNSAVTAVFHRHPATDRTVFYQQKQSKHHRWKLDRGQITRYSLGDALNPNQEWWENIEIDPREVNFFAFGQGSCFTTLICEDLARVDPCQTVIRSVGANLVIALLMDGPQLTNRWPARYGTVLAEDPGCSVLTVTSMALVNRSALLNASKSRSVALWKDAAGTLEELELPKGAQALCLTLRGQQRTEVTLDGRGDGGSALVWTLGGAVPVYHSRGTLPAWAREEPIGEP